DRAPAARRPPVEQPAIFGLALIELCVVRPPLFQSVAEKRASTFADPALGRTLIECAAQWSIHPVDVRLMDRVARNDTRFIAEGFASPDDGAPPVLPERLRLLRTALFDSDWEGMLPLERAKLPHSWSLIGAGLHLLPPGEGHLDLRSPRLYERTASDGTRIAF